VTLGGNSTFTSTGGSVTFDSTIDGAHSLSVSASGAVTFDSTVGGEAPPTGITVSGSSITLDGNMFAGSSGESLTSAASLTIPDAVTLGGNSTFTSTGGSVTFDSTIDGAHTLTVNANSASGAVTFDSTVGGEAPRQG